MNWLMYADSAMVHTFQVFNLRRGHVTQSSQSQSDQLRDLDFSEKVPACMSRICTNETTVCTK